MSSDKLNSSLDDILKTTRSSARRGRGGRRSNTSRPSTNTPVGGVQKPSKQNKQPRTAAVAPTSAGPSGGETKIVISNLPLDVEENQLKEYFITAVGVGRPKRIFLQYGANGKSLGSATVFFNRADQASKASTALQGVKIDGRSIRVEVLVNAAIVATARPQVTLAERVTQPKKDKPKPVAAIKTTSDTRQTRGKGRTRGAGRGRGGREGSKKKTVEELDAEMDDYFPNAEGDVVATNGTGAPVNGGNDTAMQDEML